MLGYEYITHRGVALSLGDVKEDNCIECPFHGMRFDSLGKCTLVPANGKKAIIPESYRIKAYTTYENNGFIYIYWGDEVPQTMPSFFDNLEGLEYRTVQDHRNIHYSRAIENQLDCAHLPFVHKKSIGRGNKTLVNGPLVKWKDDDDFFMYIYNAVDQGQKPKRPNELEPKGPRDQKLEFIFPNTWQNYITPKMRIVVAFVPVDEDNTILYLRFYQNFMLIPLIKQIVFWVFTKGNLKIAHEDRGIVETHDPKKSEFGMKEFLFQADLPIVEYRKKRDQLKKGSSKE